MSKAYDRVEWTFVKEMMRKMGFDPNWIDSIMKCVSTISYSVILNGQARDIFQPTRGLRQVFFNSNIREEEKRVVNRILGVRSSNDPERYLGLPNMVDKRKKEAFQNLKDIFKQRIENCSIRHLSQGGKEVFIKAILQTIPTYMMACFLLPKTLCEDLESIIIKFRWQKSYGKRSIHWCAWKTLCIAKDKGRLSFRSLDQFNVALLAKQDFIHAQLGNLPSLIWRCVWAAKRLLQDGLCWRVGKGDRISVWNDHWIPGVEDIVRSDDNINNTGIELVSNLIAATTRQWKTDLIENTFSENTAQKILQIPLAEEEHDDFQVWRGEHSGEFTIRSAYKLLQEVTTDPNAYLIQTKTKNFYRKLWSLHLPSKIAITIWRLSWNFIPTLKNLRLRRVASDSSSPRCRSAEEDSNHVFRRCPITTETWQNLSLSWVTNNAITDLWDWLTWVFTIGNSQQCRLFCCAAWMIWSSKNQLVHEGKTTTGRELSKGVHSYIAEIDGSKERSSTLGDDRRQRKFTRGTTATIYFDAAFDNKYSRSASGLVVQEEMDEFLASKSVLHSAISTPFMAEANAGLQAIKSENCQAHELATEALRKGEETYLEDAAFTCLQRGREERWLRNPD
ncbi:hypothetical protein CXB51_014347 [Gossypium anomalum]|uniref:Reverse transcriptase zinc-binding domain-containing protein n=1 Tax=Gossypium anomalum TaxID=47600 RepID=A0A8J5YKH6_9ROSI|nr:hypothetical protein CXB51_014347 [Gossypium anomalum]